MCCDQLMVERIFEMRDIDRAAKRRRRKIVTTIEKIVILLVLVTLIIVVYSMIRSKITDKKPEPEVKKELEIKEDQLVKVEETEIEEPSETQLGEPVPVGDQTFVGGYTAQTTAETVSPTAEEVGSEYAILIDESNGNIIVDRASRERMNPASMTKVLSLLVAADQLDGKMEKLDDKFMITLEMTDFAYVNDLSTVGFLDGEFVTVKDLFYGTILPSGGDAVYALAIYTAGSEEHFVELMNEKVEELGLSESAHFSNCAGLYSEENYCTVYDMAMILKAALENDFCREVLSAHTYTTSITAEHPEGITISNWFLRRIEDKDSGGEVIGAKTGYVVQSGNCAASYEISASGKPYICVTGKATSGWNCIYDHVAIYSTYAK